MARTDLPTDERREAAKITHVSRIRILVQLHRRFFHQL